MPTRTGTMNCQLAWGSQDQIECTNTVGLDFTLLVAKPGAVRPMPPTQPKIIPPKVVEPPGKPEKPAPPKVVKPPETPVPSKGGTREFGNTEFPSFVDLYQVVGDTGTKVLDKETALIMHLPGPFVRALVASAKRLDRWNLFPRFMTANDPMFASIFLANLGSAGISDAYHHLYEYGTVSLFGAVSAPAYQPFVEGDVLDEIKLKRVFFERPRVVYHLAAFFANQNSVDHPERDLLVNGMGTLRLLEGIRETEPWRRRYEELGKLRPAVRPVYAAIDFLQSRNLPLKPALITELARRA